GEVALRAAGDEIDARGLSRGVAEVDESIGPASAHVAFVHRARLLAIDRHLRHHRAARAGGAVRERQVRAGRKLEVEGKPRARSARYQRAPARAGEVDLTRR